MNRLIINCLVGVCALGFSAIAQAGTLTSGTEVIGWTDNESNNWLRLDVKDETGTAFLTTMNFNQMTSGFDFAGYNWQLATKSQIRNLWDDFQPNVASSGFAGYDDPVWRIGTSPGNAFLDAFGVTSSNTGWRVAKGYSADEWQPDTYYMPYVKVEVHGALNGTGYYDDWITGNGGISGSLAASTPQYSAWMISTGAAVPIPAAAWLFGSGLLGLIGFSKRKKVA